MDLKQIEYIVKIDDEHSITRAAEKLFLTQSALNQQLLRLEKELGAQLFHRSKSDWHPTAIGQVYLENAREILRIKQKTYNIISDMAETKKGRLSIGFTPGRGSEMFTHVYPLFHQAYPNVIVEPHELSVHRQQQLIAQGDLDIGFQTLSERQKTNDEYITLGREEIFLAVPSVHPAAASTWAIPYTAEEGFTGTADFTGTPGTTATPGPTAAPGTTAAPGPTAAPDATATVHTDICRAYPPIDLSLLKYEPFVLMYKESTIRAITDEIFRSSGFVPNVLFETASNNTIISMIQARLCCGVIPYYYARKQPDKVCFFSFPTHPSWDIVASYRKNTYLSEAAKTLIGLVRDFWAA